MSGQSVLDRMQAAKHSVMGSQIGKKVCKATTEEILAPKRKHLEDLLQYTHDPNVSVTDIIDLLLSRTHNQNWVVVYKSLITLHHLMNYGHEKVIQNMASRTMELNLANYYDRKDMQGAQMSPFIQRYSKYLSAKAGSYRAIAFDFCRAKRGREEGKLRNMEAHELMMALPSLSDQLEALLEFQARPSDLTNGIVIASFMLLFKDSIRLFANYNEGIINLLEKFFDMTSKKQCEQALSAYKKFLQQMENIGKFLKVAEKCLPAYNEYGIDKGDIPDLTAAPSSLLEALESHCQGLDYSDKKSGVAKMKTKQDSKPVIPKQLSVNAEAFEAVSLKPQSNNPFFLSTAEEGDEAPPQLTGISETEKQNALQEEQTEMNKFSNQAKSFNPFAPDVADSAGSSQPQQQPAKASVMDPFDDLLGLTTDTTASNVTTNTQASPFGNTAAVPSADPFGAGSGSSVSANTGGTFDPFASFGAASAPVQQNNANSNPFLQSGADKATASSSHYQPTAGYSGYPSNQLNNSSPSRMRYHVNHMPQPVSPMSPVMHGPPMQYQQAYFSAPMAAAPMATTNTSMFGGTVSGSLWTNGVNPYQQPPSAYQSMSAQPHQAVNFDAAFGNNSTSYGSSNVFGDVLQPTPIGGQQQQSMPNPMFNNGSSPMMMGGMMGHGGSSANKPNSGDASGLGKDLDSALANLATNLSTKSPTHRPTTQPQQTAW